MQKSPSKALVCTILQRAEDYPWKMQDIGLLGLRLDDRREFRLHVWDPTFSLADEDPPIHDHPYDFTSTIIAGDMTNTRYNEDLAGTEFTRFRVAPSDESNRAVDTVRLSGTATTYAAGGCYRQSRMSCTTVDSCRAPCRSSAARSETSHG